MLAIISIAILFHFCIIFKLIPYQIAWGGQIKTDAEMYVFETLSILILLFLSLILLMKGNYIIYKFSRKVVNVSLWIFFVVFILNAIGNLFAKTNIEKIFALTTLVLAVLIWRVLHKKTI